MPDFTKPATRNESGALEHSTTTAFPRFWLYAAILALLISIAAACVAARNRPPWSDEGWFSSAAYNLAHNGFFGTTVVDGADSGLTGIHQHTYWVMPLYLLAQALWYKILPATLFFTRLLNIFLIPFALWGFYLFLSRLLRRTNTAGLAVCLLALSFIFIDNAGFARPDFLCCTLGIWGLAAYLYLREKSLNWALFVANAFIAASGLTHPNGLLHFFGLLTLVLWYDRRRLSLSRLAIAAAPYFILGGIWLVYVFQDFPAFVAQMRANGTDNHRWTSTLNPFLIVWNEIRYRYFVAFGFITRGVALVKAYALAAYVAAIIGCLVDRRLRQRSSTRLLLVLLAVYFCVMSVFNQKLSYYLIHILPFYIALLAVWCAHLWSVYPRARRFVAAGLLILVSVETGGILLKARKRSYVATQSTMIRFVHAHSSPSARVVGSAALLYGLNFDPRLRDDYYLGTKSGRPPDVIIIGPLYRDIYEHYWNKERPAAMRKIDKRLSAYKLVFRNSDYQVYFRPDDPHAHL
ncbi:MAG: hypothetical protein ACRD4Q_14215 [Candidatus Acidiferrales bacterium]